MSTHPFEDLQLTNAQSECFALGLVDLAKSDGMHQSELELIEEFLSSSGGGDLDELMKKGFSAATAAELLSGKATNAFFYSCFLLAYADGALSEIEMQRIKSFAATFGLDDTQLEAAHDWARTYLVSALAKELKNQTLVREIAAHLGMSTAQIDAALLGDN